MTQQTFILQKHQAERAGPHQDLYLEEGLHFRSFAIPKGVSPMVGVKRLAIKVPDHSPQQANFEGTIAEGYGKGTKEVIDEGSYLEPVRGTLLFFGSHLKGRYHMNHLTGNEYLLWKA